MMSRRALVASAAAVVVLGASIAAVQSDAPNTASSLAALDGADCIVLKVNGVDVYTAPACSSATTTTIGASTTSTTSAPATSTTAPPVPTTTAPTTSTSSSTSTTSTSPTATAPSTTTTTMSMPMPTTTAPPANGILFSEPFETPAGFYSRFDYGWSGGDSSTANPATQVLHWHGDHNMACEAPTTMRDIDISGPAHVGVGPITAQNPGKDPIFWWCAPGADSLKGHVMTGINTTGYNIAWFAPKGYFTNVKKVCWDQNLNDISGKWVQVVIATRADVEREAQENGHLDLGFVGPGFQDPAGPTTGVIPAAGTVGVKIQAANFSFWTGNTFPGSAPGNGQNGEEFFDRIGTAVNAQGQPAVTDRATRYRHCVEDIGNGTIKLTQMRPGATASGGYLDTRFQPGAFPTGEVRVVFEDDTYDAPKREGYSPDNVTWHFDQIVVSS